MDDMKFSFISTRTDVKRMLTTFGTTITVKTTDGATMRCAAVAVQKKQDESNPTAPVMSMVKTQKFYVPGDLRKAPDVGGTIEVSSNEAYLISEVSPVKPANTVIAYILTVEG